MTLPVPITKEAGTPRCHQESKTLPVRQIRPSYCATSSLPLATGGPVPWISVSAWSVPGGAAFGIVLARRPRRAMGSPTAVSGRRPSVGWPCVAAVFGSRRAHPRRTPACRNRSRQATDFRSIRTRPRAGWTAAGGCPLLSRKALFKARDRLADDQRLRLPTGKAADDLLVLGAAPGVPDDRNGTAAGQTRSRACVRQHPQDRGQEKAAPGTRLRISRRTCCGDQGRRRRLPQPVPLDGPARPGYRDQR
jgi:hypothetical protein